MAGGVEGVGAEEDGNGGVNTMRFSDHKAFYRPSTAFNLIAEHLAREVSEYAPITESCLYRWQESSKEVYQQIVDKPSALERILTDPCWELSDEDPPRDVWFGEAKFNGKEIPQLIIYKNSLTTALKKPSLVEMAGQCGLDHLFGHLYAFYAGEDFGEEAACSYQYRAARQRKGMLCRITTATLPLIYLLHKKIPLGNFR